MWPSTPRTQLGGLLLTELAPTPHATEHVAEHPSGEASPDCVFDDRIPADSQPACNDVNGAEQSGFELDPRVDFRHTNHLHGAPTHELDALGGILCGCFVPR